jgi:hypothetical protein
MGNQAKIKSQPTHGLLGKIILKSDPQAGGDWSAFRSSGLRKKAQLASLSLGINEEPRGKLGNIF